MQNGFPPLTYQDQLAAMEQYGGMEALGGPHMNNHYSSAWAWAGSTPFPWVKQVASHFGGIMSATAIRYPQLIGKEQQGVPAPIPVALNEKVSVFFQGEACLISLNFHWDAFAG